MKQIILGNIIEDLKLGLLLQGSKKLNIPKCGFCKEYYGTCCKCQYSSIFTYCNLEWSHWVRTISLVDDILDKVRYRL